MSQPKTKNIDIQKLREQFRTVQGKYTQPIVVQPSTPISVPFNYTFDLSKLPFSGLYDQDYTSNDFCGADYWMPCAGKYDLKTDTYKEPKCTCGMAITMGRDHQQNHCSDWCDIKDGKK